MTRPYPARFRVKAQLGEEDHVIDPTEDLFIRGDLSKAMRRQPGLFAWYAGLAEEEAHRGRKLKAQIERMSEDLDEKIRREGKKPTEKQISAQIKRHPMVRALQDKYLATMRRVGHLKVLKEAFAQRANLLQSVGVTSRKEMDAELRTLQKRMQNNPEEED